MLLESNTFQLDEDEVCKNDAQYTSSKFKD